jgi:sulfonate transport system ATP-binding protein
VVAEGVHRRFGDRTVLDRVDLRIAPGEFVALLGRSGTDKSTLLRALAGLDPDYEGALRVPRQRAVVFQEPRLLPSTRVLGNVALGLSGGADATVRARAALAEVGLTGHKRAWPVTLSGGEAQRVALARALVREPALLLLDEPFGALDALTRLRMHALLADLCREHQPAVLLVTHDVDEAIVLGDRVLLLAEGRIFVDRPVKLPAPRRRGDPGFIELRSQLLDALGDDETLAGSPATGRAPRG